MASVFSHTGERRKLRRAPTETLCLRLTRPLHATHGDMQGSQRAQGLRVAALR